MSKGRILIVDDSKLQREKLRDILLGGGYEVTEADDGLAGFQLAIKEKPDLVISDIQMPTLDGIGFCKGLKEHGATRSIPVVFMSTLDSMDDLVKGLEAGANDYLSKHSDGPEQILAMAEVHTAYSRRIRSSRPVDDTDDEAAKLAGEEFQAVREIPATFFDGLTFGLVIADLRRQPIYMNPTARQLLGYSPTAPVAALGGDDFQTFLSAAARAYQHRTDQFFFAVERQGSQLGVHLEQIYSSRREICGVLLCLHTGLS